MGQVPRPHSRRRNEKLKTCLTSGGTARDKHHASDVIRCRREAKVTILCLGALLAGMVAASLMPFLPFACTVLIAIIIGAASTLVGGTSVAQILLSAAALLFTAQIGYGLGVVAVALVGHALPAARSLKKHKQGAHPTRVLHTGDKPR